MRRKKQFVALSLAAILAWGGVFPVSNPISSVRAEEAQTELSVDDSTTPSTETPADESTAPSTETSADGTTTPSVEAPVVQPTVPSAEAVGQPADTATMPSLDAASGELQVPSVSNNNPGISLFANSNAPIERGAFDFSSWDMTEGSPDKNNNPVFIISPGTYTSTGNVVSVEFVGKGMDYIVASKEIAGSSYAKAIKTKDKGPATPADPTTTPLSDFSKGVIKITSTKDAEITVAMDYPKAEIYLQCGDSPATAVTMASKKADEITFTVEAGKEYYLWSIGANMQIYNVSYAYEGEGPIEFPEGDFPAFPGAEGGGMYATGGRGGDVYVVTNLNDDGEGSLRYGINTAPAAGRTIVFDVGGTIQLESTLTFKQKQNITIAGQTAPGDGITIEGFDTNISDSKNIVIRFVRFRVGSRNLIKGGDSMDALWGRDNDTFMIDHCTFSWNTDETLSTYRGRNGTVQWCIISESLTVSGHSKGRHGYGGIFGGDNTVFQYNLLANHTSRNPRIGGGSMTDPIADAKDPTKTPSTATLQLSNNVLYNHGFFPCYGGGYAYTNYINNYVKPGVGTRDNIMDSLINVGENGKFGGFYVNGNVLEGNDAITANNALGIKEDAPDYISSTPYTTSDAAKFDFDAFATVNPISAEDCYDLVLNSAGATYPVRDAIDARVVAQVKTDTGFYVNRPEEVGGYPALEEVRAEDEGRVDSDHDGIPDDWETAHGLNPNSPADDLDSIKPATNDPQDPNYGYSWLEVYCNWLVEDVVADGYTAMNPDVTIDLANNTLVNEGDSVTVTANATANGGATIDRVEFYNGDQLVGTESGGSCSYTYTGLADGTYNISVRAYDSEGRATQSNTSKLHVNSTAGTGEWKSQDIGHPTVPGTASLTDGVLTVKGAGKLGKSEGSVAGTPLNSAASDDFHYVYQEMTGDTELVTRLDYYTAVDCHTFNGLMFRESLDEDAATVALGLTMTKIWDGYSTVWTAFMMKRDQKGGNITEITETVDSASAAEKAGIPILTDLNFKTGDTYNGTWLKLTRVGDVFTGAVSNDGLVWQALGSFTVDLPDTIYVGFAVDAGKAANKLENYATAEFSNIKVNTAFGTITYDMENVEYSGAEQFAVGEDISVVLTNVKGYLLPETVTVTVDGKEVAVDYDREKGIISLKNLSGNVVVTAKGVKRPVVPVTFEEVDPQDLLTVEEKDGKLILTQIAESGSTSTGFPGDDSYKGAVNESWILFPEVTQPHEMTLQITVTKLLPVAKNDNTGVFIGVFDVTEGQQAFDSLGFRPCTKTAEAVSKFWTKGDKTGNGGTKQPITMGEVYTVTFSYDKNGQYTVKWENESGSKASETFKTNENYFKKGDAVRYGIGLIGATVEITSFTYTDHEGNMIYNMESADYTAVTAAIEKASQLNPEDYVNFDAVLDAWNAVVLGLSKTEQAKVDAMAKAIEDAIAALEKKPEENPDKPDITQEIKAEVSATIPEAVLTQAVKDKTGCSNVAELITYLQNTVVKETYAGASSVVWEVTIKVSTDGGNTWVDADKDNIPKEGVDVILPYPEGTNKNDYDFTVSHLITQDWNGQVPGTMEYPEVTKTEEGLKIHVLSASPFAIAWKPVGTDKPAEPDDDDDPEEVGENVTTQAVKTGDNMNVAAVIWSIVFLAAAAGAGVLVYRRRHGADGTKTE